MRLRELGATFVRWDPRDEWVTVVAGDPKQWKAGGPTERVFKRVDYLVDVDRIAEADGVTFLCPVCFVANGGSVGTHSVCCWRPRVPQTVKPVPGRWEFQGTGIDDLTLVAGSSSVLLQGPCGAHFFVRNGAIA